MTHIAYATQHSILHEDFWVSKQLKSRAPARALGRGWRRRCLGCLTQLTGPCQGTLQGVVLDLDLRPDPGRHPQDPSFDASTSSEGSALHTNPLATTKSDPVAIRSIPRVFAVGYQQEPQRSKSALVTRVPQDFRFTLCGHSGHCYHPCSPLPSCNCPSVIWRLERNPAISSRPQQLQPYSASSARLAAGYVFLLLETVRLCYQCPHRRTRRVGLDQANLDSVPITWPCRGCMSCARPTV